MQLRTIKDLPEGPNADSLNRVTTTSSERESTPAPPNADDPGPHGITDIGVSEVCVTRKITPVSSETICVSEAAAEALNVDISVMKTYRENIAKRKAVKLTDSIPHDLAMVSDDFKASCKKQKRLVALDVENETSDQDCNSSGKSRQMDVDLHRKVEQMPTKNSGSASYDEGDDMVRVGQEGSMEVLELKHFSNSRGEQIEGVSRSSEWKPMEKELYMKGLEIFGRNR